MLQAVRPATSPTAGESIGFVFQTFNLLKSLNALEIVEIALNIAGDKGAEAEGQQVTVQDGHITAYRVDLKVTFVVH